MSMRPILLFLLGGWFMCQGQNLTQYTAIQQGNDVLISYQLNGEKGKAHTIALYSSHNNFTAPLQMVEGDVGTKRILPGSGKSIRWRALEELKNFDGDITFEIRVAPAIPLFSKISTSTQKIKRGKEITISWTGGNAQEQLMVELVKGSRSINLGTISNRGHLQYAVPRKTKLGKYRIQLEQAGELTQGGEFKVIAKYPWWIKVIPVAVVGGIIALWPTEDKFPGPPDLTGN